jgi:hypothetical protein
MACRQARTQCCSLIGKHDVRSLCSETDKVGLRIGLSPERTMRKSKLSTPLIVPIFGEGEASRLRAKIFRKLEIVRPRFRHGRQIKSCHSRR